MGDKKGSRVGRRGGGVPVEGCGVGCCSRVTGGGEGRGSATVGGRGGVPPSEDGSRFGVVVRRPGGEGGVSVSLGQPAGYASRAFFISEGDGFRPSCSSSRCSAGVLGRNKGMTSDGEVARPVETLSEGG